MELRDSFNVLRRRWILIAAITVVVVGSVLAYSFAQIPVYDAKATCMVRATATGDAQYMAEEIIQQLMQTINKIAVTRPVLEEASKRMGGSISLEKLQNSVTSEVVTNTQIIQITARNEKPGTAMLEANAVADSLIAFFNQQNPGNNTYRIEKVEPAVTPASPISPKPVKNGIIACFLGLLVGIACAVLLESLEHA